MKILKLSALILIQLIGQISGQANCVTNQAVMTCYYEIPKDIPEQVHKVFIRELNASLESANFLDESWKRVQWLDIQSNLLEFFQMKSGTFSPLKLLRHLGFHHRLYFQMDKHAFSGLDNVEVLDLSGCIRLYLIGQSIEALSEKSVLPRINTLNLIDVGNHDNRPFPINADTVRMIKNKGIITLLLGNQTLLLEGPLDEVMSNPPYDPFPIESIYASSIIFVNSLGFREIDGFHFWDCLKNLKTVNLSNLNYPRPSVQHHLFTRDRKTSNSFIFTRILFFKEFILLNSTLPLSGITNYVDASFYTHVRLKRLIINSCNIKNVNMTWIIPNNAYLDEINLSNNGIDYFFIIGNMQAKKLILCNNNLQNMNNFPEFRQIFVSFPIMEYLDLGANGFRRLPSDIFSGNMQLKILILNSNELTSVPKQLKDLQQLQFLDLRKNMIRFLDSNALGEIQIMLQLFNITVDITMNPLECSCKTTDFVKWISTITNHKQRHTCYMEGKLVTIDYKTFRDCKFLCYRDILYVGIAMTCLIVACVVIVMIIKRYVTLQNKAFHNVRKAFIENFKAGHVICNAYQHKQNAEDTLEVRRKEFLVMLAYHPDDYDTCTNEIYHPLNNGLKALLGTENELVFFGLDSERPGASVFAEIERCIQISCVFVCLVTKEFCMDHMCQLALDNADIEGKPIVFLIREKVDGVIPHVMKPLSRRAYTVAIHDQYQTLNWETICKDILDLAVKANVKFKSSYSVTTVMRQRVCNCFRSFQRRFRAMPAEDTRELIEM